LALALALSVSTTVEAVILAAVLRIRLGGVSSQTRDWFLQVLGATSVTTIVAAALAGPLAEATTPGNGPRLQQVAVFVFAIAVVAAVYFGCAWILRIPEVFQFVDHLTSRIQRLRHLPRSARR
jgi:peptidoglycan biosynthesis protein MviN/MurJ (putative lipid II flippase)